MVERVFGTFRRGYGFQRSRYVGLAKVQGQLHLLAMAFNIKKAVGNPPILQGSEFILDGSARFNEEDYIFDLLTPVCEHCREGRYHLVSKNRENISGDYLYRLSHPLGEHVLQAGKDCEAPAARVTFHYSAHPTRISLLEALQGKRGWLTLQKLRIESFQMEEYLLFSGFTEDGESLDQETCEKLFQLHGSVEKLDSLPLGSFPDDVRKRLQADAERHAAATCSKSLEMNNRFYQEERKSWTNGQTTWCNPPSASCRTPRARSNS